MLSIYYAPEDKDSVALRDAEIEGYVNSVVEDYNINGDTNKSVYIGSELIVAYFRVEVQSGRIGYKDIQFIFRDRFIKCDKNGQLNEWPDGFCDYNDKVTNVMLGWS